MPMLTWGALELNPSSRQVAYSGQDVPLTPKEYALIELLLRHSDRTFSAKVILDRIWAAEDYPGEEAVRTHIKGLRQKLRTAGAPAELIETIHRVGYRLNPLAILPEAVPPDPAAAALMPPAPAMTSCVLAVAPEPLQPSLHQALDDDETLQIVIISQYADLWPALKTHAPVLLILSYDLDPEQSLDLCRTLKQQALWQGLPIIVVLSAATIHAIHQVFLEGASDVIIQPFFNGRTQRPHCPSAKAEQLLLLTHGPVLRSTSHWRDHDQMNSHEYEFISNQNEELYQVDSIQLLATNLYKSICFLSIRLSNY